MNIVIDKLQAVPVSRNDDALPAVSGTDLPHRSDHIVRFPALAGVDGDIHGPEHILHHRHLLGKLFRHTVAGGLIPVKLFVPEGGAVEVKGHAHRVGLLFLFHPLQDVQKAVNGIGIQAVPGRQGLYAEKRPVDDAVPVQDHQLHTLLHLVPWGVSMISICRKRSSSRIMSASAKFFSFFAFARVAIRASISGSDSSASSFFCS